MQKAELYAAALRDQGVPAVVNNAHLSALLPVGEVSLSIPASEKDRALHIVREMEMNEDREMEEDFREADLEDIYYQQELHIREKSRVNKAVWILLLIIIALLLILTFTNNTSFLPY